MTRIAFLLSSIAPLAFAAVPAAAQSMDHSTHGSTPAPAPSHSPAQVAKPAPEAPAEQMDHDSMPVMDMEPKAPRWVIARQRRVLPTRRPPTWDR